MDFQIYSLEQPFQILHWGESQKCSDNSACTRCVHILPDISLKNCDINCKAADSERPKSIIQGEAEPGLRFPPLTLGSEWISPHIPTSIFWDVAFPLLCLLHHIQYLFPFTLLPSFLPKLTFTCALVPWLLPVFFLLSMAGVFSYPQSLPLNWFLPFLK